MNIVVDEIYELRDEALAMISRLFELLTLYQNDFFSQGQQDQARLQTQQTITKIVASLTWSEGCSQ
jgi:hypothetical protein